MHIIPVYIPKKTHQTHRKPVTFETLPLQAVIIQITIFWEVTPYNLAEMYQSVKGTWCLHLRD
jgi:hypothetical protein